MLADTLSEIEDALDAGTYRPGQWMRFLEEARACPDGERALLAARVSEVSARLHDEKRPTSFPLESALVLEAAGVLVGAACAGASRAMGSSLLALGAATMWMSTLQPLLKVGVGTAFGVEFEHAYLWKGEPRFKMRYGSYLARPRWQRIGFHLAGCLGAPLGAALAGAIVRGSNRRAARLCDGASLLLAASNALFLAGGLLGKKRLLGIPTASSSGGAAGIELREALTAKRSTRG